MGKARETILEIDLRALEHNYRYLRSKLGPETKFLGVVKAFAYGSDSKRIALKLQDLGIDYLAVAYVKEGVALRNAGVTKPILVLHPQAVNFDQLIEHCLEPSIYSPRILRAFLKTAKKHRQKDYPVHIKFNTGLNRLGFWENDVSHITEEISGGTELRIHSVFSHLAASEDLNEVDFTQKQIETFDKITTQIDHKLGYRPFRHLLNTSGIINYPEAQYDMVRSGIGLYGFGNEAQIDAELKPVATLKTIISQIHRIEPGESVGYNRAFFSNGYRTTATLPLGHADGIGRQYGHGKTYVEVNGQKAFIIGNVCMDMLMIDITGIDCKEGDEVIVFGKNPNADRFAATADTISYELLTGISQRVNRLFIGD
ncbi:alanine racemase [Flavobacteriaceae bacterium TP-CH-4]|uniref:Alanine racemase n=1 Tax=Pelagihabitans pacificus TaxID=2696054 RepID=A0A967E502_9FLAO|nr:alanine racemase [Pelagihabitans pacificus]NHF58922.1 alanine racemase [Pelagihabitans pacificus]